MKHRVIPNLSSLNLIDDHRKFARLSPRVQEDVLFRLDWIVKIESVSHGKRGRIKQAAAEALNVSIPTVDRFVRGFRDGGWRALQDQRGKNNKPLPEAFKAFVRQLHLQCQRATTGREVQRMLIERWRLWQKTGDDKHAIPGYETPPAAGPKGYPAGWSDDNILRFRPDEYALSVARQGSKRAAGFLPSILKTRVGLKFGQVVLTDDQWYDVRVAAPGLSQKVIRPLGFNVLDFYSGCFLSHSIRFRFWDAEVGHNRELTQQDYVWSVISYLQTHGYRRDSHGTTLVGEHGTASGFNSRSLSTFADYHNFDEALLGVTGGHVRFERSGLFNQPAFADLLFRPQSSGNPNFKSPLESMFNPVRNRMAALPGATGLNRDMKPAESYGLDLYAEQMLKVWGKLDERHRKLIRFPMMTASEFGEVAGQVYHAINSRTDHQLEGWERCGFVAPQLRFTPDERSSWLSREEVNELPDDVRAMLLAKAETPGHVRPYRLSPADVARQCAGELTKLPDHVIPLLVPRQWARPATVKSDRTIGIKDQLLGPEAFTYVCRFENGAGFTMLSPGTKVLCYLNPFNAERLVICQEDGAFLGTLHQQTRAGWLDQEAILEQLKERAEIKADLDATVRPHLEGLIADRAEMKRTNARLAEGKPVLPEEIAAARVAAAEQGQRTAAANRLNEHGEARDWDTVEAPAEPAWQDPFECLPDGTDFPDSI